MSDLSGILSDLIDDLTPIHESEAAFAKGGRECARAIARIYQTLLCVRSPRARQRVPPWRPCACLTAHPRETPLQTQGSLRSAPLRFHADLAKWRVLSLTDGP
jgi:hypothetical protein